MSVRIWISVSFNGGRIKLDDLLSGETKLNLLFLLSSFVPLTFATWGHRDLVSLVITSSFRSFSLLGAIHVRYLICYFRSWKGILVRNWLVHITNSCILYDRTSLNDPFSFTNSNPDAFSGIESLINSIHFPSTVPQPWSHAIRIISPIWSSDVYFGHGIMTEKWRLSRHRPLGHRHGSTGPINSCSKIGTEDRGWLYKRQLKWGNTQPVDHGISNMLNAKVPLPIISTTLHGNRRWISDVAARCDLPHLRGSQVFFNPTMREFSDVNAMSDATFNDAELTGWLD